MNIIKTNAVVEVPAGSYYLGDPCYTVPDRLWGEVLESCDYFSDPVGVVRGHHVLAFSTKYGDGTYHDEAGNSYPVDAGLIGLVPVALVEEQEKGEVERSKCSRIVTFTKPVQCWADDGTLHFGNITIETGEE
jgi:hypothetical protein